MTANVNSRVIDFGLNVLDTEPDKIFICSTQPTTYTEATSTYALGSYNYGSAGAAFGSPASATNARKVSSVAITSGSVSGTGTAGYWAVVDSANSRLLATGPLSASQAVTSGNPFSLPSFDITIPTQ